MILAIAGGFLLLAVANGIDWASREPAYKTLDIAVWELLYNGSACFATIVTCLTYSWIRTRLRGIWLVPIAAALCFAGGVVWVAIAQTLIQFVALPSWANITLSWRILVTQGGLASGCAVFLVSSFYFAIEHWWEAHEQGEKARRATALAHHAQLQMLRYQINPHFLFNALNSIRGMIVEDPRRSREMVCELADFLRYTLAMDGQDSTIADEVQAIQNYLAIQRIRFEDRLEATVDAAPEALTVVVPCFLIHPLVENAVKYGMKTNQAPLRLEVKVTRSMDELQIRVSNTGRLLTPGELTGDSAQVGLRNIRERLALAYPERHSFTLEEAGGWVHAVIKLKEPQA